MTCLARSYSLYHPLMLLALPCWGDEILRGHAPEDKGEPREWSILILSVVGARPREVPTCAQGAHPLAARSWHNASCCRILPPLSHAIPRGFELNTRLRTRWHGACFALRACVPRCSAAPCRAAVSTAHAHRPLGEREAHGMGKEQSCEQSLPRRRLPCLRTACCARGSPHTLGDAFWDKE